MEAKKSPGFIISIISEILSILKCSFLTKRFKSVRSKIILYSPGDLFGTGKMWEMNSIWSWFGEMILIILNLRNFLTLSLQIFSFFEEIDLG